MNGDLKQTFILKCLNTFLQEGARAMIAAGAKNKIGKSGEGLKSISYNALQSGGGAVGQLKFREYLRFVDMGVGRGHPLGGLSSMKVTLQAQNKEGYAQVKSKIRKPKKVYSKPVYGNIVYLQNQLLYGYTETTIQMLKKEINEPSNRVN